MRCVRCQGLCVQDEAEGSEGQVAYARCVNCGACHGYSVVEGPVSKRHDFESHSLSQRRADQKRQAAIRSR